MATSKKTSTKKKAAAGRAIATRKATNIVDIEKQMSDEAAAIMDTIGSPGGNKIKTTDKLFTFPDGSVEPGPVELVIVDYLSMNAMYEGKWDPKNPQPPACFAIGKQPKQMKPSANSPEAQSKDCASCPMNQFGSDGDGKACKNMRVLAVLRPEDDPNEAPPMRLEVSPTGLKSFDACVATIAKMYQAPPVKVVVTASFHPEKTYSQLVFSDPRPNPDFAAHYNRRDEASVLLTAEPDVSGFQKAAKPARRRRA